MSTLINCPTCGKQVSSGAAACPHCGEPVKDAEVKTKIKGRHLVFFLFGGLFLLLGIMTFSGWISTGSREFLTMAVVFLCGGVFAIVGPFCKLK